MIVVVMITLLQALATLDKVVSDKLEDLIEITATPTGQLKSVTDFQSPHTAQLSDMLQASFTLSYLVVTDDTLTFSLILYRHWRLWTR